MTETATPSAFKGVRLHDAPTLGRRAAPESPPAPEPDTTSIKVSIPEPPVVPRRAAPAATPTDTFNPLLDDDEDETAAASSSEPADFNPLLDDEDEDESHHRTAVVSRSQGASSRSGNRAGQPVTDASRQPDDARRAEAKARRAEKRKQNHAEHPVWYRRRAGGEPRDKDYLNFIARHKEVKAVQLAALHGVTKHTAYKRLKGLESYGFVREQKVYDQSSVWLLTQKGMDYSDYDLSALPKGRSNADQRAHDLVVAHVAANWAGGTFDVLDRDKEAVILPVRDSKGKHLEEQAHRRFFQKRFVTEYQIRADVGRITQELQAERRLSDREVADALQLQLAAGDWNWQEAEQPARFTLFMPEGSSLTGKTRIAFTDLVLVSPHPSSSKKLKKVAVEVELSHKATERLQEKLNAYLWNDTFDEVIYVVPEPALRRKIERIGKELGLTNLRVIPLYVLNKNGERVAHNDSWIRF